MALPKDIQQATVIAACANPLPNNIIRQYGKRVIRISDHAVVKWGLDVTKEEAENQSKAQKLVDSRIVRIPRVYDFFSDDQGRGYLVMEFIEGEVIDPLEEETAVKKVAAVLNYFATLRCTTPGSLCGGLVADSSSLRLKTWSSIVLTGGRSGSIAGFSHTIRS